MQDILIEILRRIAVPYHPQRFLELKYKDNESILYRQISGYEEKINYFSSLDFVKSFRDRNCPQENLATPRTSEDDFSKVAKDSAVYFQQGLEMFKTSLTMSENSSPLVEYYGLLQCVKGAVLLELDINQTCFFRKHGIIVGKGDSKYINAKIMPFGVFSALLLRVSSNKMMDFFLSGDYCPSMEEIIQNRNNGNQGVVFQYGAPVKAFIGLWMLSTLVRYRPGVWQEIFMGEKDDIIIKIREFRTGFVPAAIEILVDVYFDPNF